MHAVSNSMGHGGHGLNLIPETDMCKLRQWTTGGQEQKMKHGERLHGRRKQTGRLPKKSKVDKALLIACVVI